jgi:hypothetical protein
VPLVLLLKVLLLLWLLRSLLTLSRAAAAAVGRGGLGLALPAGAAAAAAAAGLVDVLATPEGRELGGGGLVRGFFLPMPALAAELLLLVPALLLLLVVMWAGDAVCLGFEGWGALLLLLLLLLPGLSLAGVGGALQLEVLLLLPACWPSVSESPSSEPIDKALGAFCLMLHRVCTREEDLQVHTGDDC